MEPLLNCSLTIDNAGSGLIAVEDDGLLEESLVVEVVSFSGFHSVSF